MGAVHRWCTVTLCASRPAERRLAGLYGQHCTFGTVSLSTSDPPPASSSAQLGRSGGSHHAGLYPSGIIPAWCNKLYSHIAHSNARTA
eukprot:55464-Eustigmatos_ZCMA.PRE.4